MQFLLQVSSTRSSIDLNVKTVPNLPTSPIQNSVIPTVEVEYPAVELALNNCSDAELRAIKKQQRMIKNR